VRLWLMLLSLILRMFFFSPVICVFCGGKRLGFLLISAVYENRIQTWALEEARRRLEAEGILQEPDDK